MNFAINICKVFMFLFNMETFDVRLKTPFTLILAGASGCGKTTWLEKLIKYFKVITDGGVKYERLLWFSGTKQPALFQRIKSTFTGTVKFFDSISKEIYEQVESEGKNSLIVIEDLMQETSGMSGVGKLFTKGRSHLDCNIILLWLNVFPNGSEARTLSINTHHMVLFKNPRDKSQVRYFAQHVAPGKVKQFLDVFADATSKKYGYLHCDFTQDTPDKLRFRTNIFPREQPKPKEEEDKENNWKFKTNSNSHPKVRAKEHQLLVILFV